MLRREFVTGVGATTIWPLAARAQQAWTPVIGFLSPGSAQEVQDAGASFSRMMAFRAG